MLEAILRVYIENPIEATLLTILGVIAASMGIKKWR